VESGGGEASGRQRGLRKRSATLAGPPGFDLLSEDDAARFLIREFGHRVRYCLAGGGWFIWDGSRFNLDRDGAILRLVSEATDRVLAMVEKLNDLELRKKTLQYVIRLRRYHGHENVARLAASKRPVAIGDPEAFDADPWLLNVRNGTIDLRTGTLRPHDRRDLLTKRLDVTYRANARATRWHRFLCEIFDGDLEMVDFAQRAAGYCLTGDMREHVFFVLYGRGANGKSTFVETLQTLLGEYAQSSDPETWLRQSNGHRGASPGIARLRGVRFVAGCEIDDGRALDEARVKQIVAGDRTTARQLYQNEFDFFPVCKLWISTNHPPQIRGTDDGIWRRVILIPFQVQFTGGTCDPQLAAKLRAEFSGILAWAVRGCLEWQNGGLRPPESVRRATAAYRAQSDVVGQFVTDECVADARCSTGATALFDAYRRWCEGTGERTLTQTAFGRRLTEAGYESGRTGTGRKCWRGIGLRDAKD